MPGAPTGPRKHKALSDAFLKSQPPGEYADGDGLRCVIKTKGYGRWEGKYPGISPKTGKRITRDIRDGLGPFPLVGVAAARIAWAKIKLQLHEGVSPVDEKRKAVETAKNQKTFGQCFEQLMKLKEQESRSRSTLKSWRYRLTKYCGHWFKRPVGEITRDDILAVLEPVWNVFPVAAEECRMRMEAVFDVAVENHLIDINLAEKRRFKSTLASRSRHTVKHFKGLQFQDIPGFLQKLAAWAVPSGDEYVDPREYRYSRAAIIEVVLLTVVRNGSARLARVGEFDLENRIWTIPVEHMKIKKMGAFVVPLSDRVIEIVTPLLKGKKATELVFNGLLEDNPLCYKSLLDPLKDLTGDPEMTTHGDRAAFKAWSRWARIDWDIAEQCMAHAIGNQSSRSYDHVDPIERRRETLDRWADFCTGKAGGENILPFRKTA